jgi:hypothetical protein
MPQQPSSIYPECRHILTSGRKCHSPALSGKPFCFHHSRHRNYAGRNQRSIDSVELPPLEDQSSILVAINQVVFALTRGRITDKLAGRLLYAIQLAQNSINRTESLADAEMVTDYLDGRYGDIVAPAEPEAKTSPETSAEDDDLPLLSEYIKIHSGHGDTCWEPTNGDYPDHPAEPAEDELVPAEAIQESSCNPEPRSSTVILSEFTTGERVEGSVVAFQASARANELSAEPDPVPSKPAPPKPGPQKVGPQKPGPWDNPLLDHIVHQLESGMSEREIAAQLSRDLAADKIALSS